MRLLAYTSLGLRYAFDADHIDAIDNTVRKLIQQQRNPVGIGFYFSIGHSTVFFFMSVFLGISINGLKMHYPTFKKLVELLALSFQEHF